ncbi:hypothetical protein AVEN_83518-1 [Araneus ventricosus]|uniref:Uncharacterized protein n=1 Tax=Araneus ventricosus TaxID=182803 RepID=A0A4Y2TSW5_ARAVE|nr:hypothetical protein AVEN_83518-1 [Araneus ventricosus]
MLSEGPRCSSSIRPTIIMSQISLRKASDDSPRNTLIISAFKCCWALQVELLKLPKSLSGGGLSFLHLRSDLTLTSIHFSNPVSKPATFKAQGRVFVAGDNCLSS